MTKRSLRRGFTLIEVLVVVLIIAVLAAVALPQYQKAVMKNRYATLMVTVNTLATAEEIYFMEHGVYTNNFESLAVQPSGCTLSNDKRSCTYPWGSCVLDIQWDDNVSCVNKSTLNNGYAYYFKGGKYHNGGRRCWAFSSEDKYNKLCEQMGGIKKINYGSANCPPHGTCAMYAL